MEVLERQGILFNALQNIVKDAELRWYRLKPTKIEIDLFVPLPCWYPTNLYMNAGLLIYFEL